MWVVLWGNFYGDVVSCLGLVMALYAIKLWFACKFYSLLRDPHYWDDIPRAIPIRP